MENRLLVGASALWLGILTSVSPCPLATNVAAISFVGRRIASPRQVFLAGLLYTMGRSLAYLVLGVLLVGSLLSMPRVSLVLQTYMNKLLGPLMVLVGMFLLDMIKINLPGSGIGKGIQERIEAWGVWGAGALGIVFALSFCPVSAALFFGSLIPLAIDNSSSVLLPALYGVGTGLPVFAVAVLIASGAHAVGKTLDKLALIGQWARQITGCIFLGVGIYYSLAYTFGIL
ncbi:MAG: sulfite exporter TauE/SafE family protein [Anaerolineae bacterium]|nr:sulfite exporter TauE/SafE family protein [Anaerolineae bacterium]